MAEELNWLSLPGATLEEVKRNTSLSQSLARIIHIAKEADAELTTLPVLDKSRSLLLYHVAAKFKPQTWPRVPLVALYIVKRLLGSDQQVDAAHDFLLKHVGEEFDEGLLKEAAGVGIVVTPEQIDDAVRAVIDRHREQILDQRYGFNVGQLIREVREIHKWANGAIIKTQVEARISALLGPKTLEELTPQGKKKAAKQSASSAAAPAKAKAKANAKVEAVAPVEEEESAETIEELLRTRARFHKVGENFVTDGYPMVANTKELLRKHVEAVGGRVVTRFPPEPNGVLHIGHAKAIGINFGYANMMGGSCVLRFDDTNPEKEEERFFKGIEDVVSWLGYKPAKITHSSDYFHRLYDIAVQLIKDNHAYVCHQRVEDIRGFEVQESPWRNRPVKESLQLFEDMKHGKFAAGTATLRLKVKLEEGKVDPVAYRIKYVPHPKAGDEWCIYPTYDYTHCLCDSFENITHSLCTKEFQSRRSSYYWLCNVANVYCPVQWEYSRLNVNYTVVSKRKILKLIQNKIVADYDDPRLFTLIALRRRGIPSEVIKTFVAKLGLTVAQTSVNPVMLDAILRDHLNANAPRTMAVLDPIKVIIANADSFSLPTTLKVPDFPAQPENPASHNVAVRPVVYIEQDDFREDGVKVKGFRRLTKDQAVGLKYLGIVLRFQSLVKDASGKVTEITVTAEALGDKNKPPAFIHWVADPLPVEVRLYDRLFLHSNPEDPVAVPGGFLTDCNPNSLVIHYGAVVDRHVAKAAVYDRFQFERVGYFSVDPDSKGSKLVFNRTVALREDAGKV